MRLAKYYNKKVKIINAEDQMFLGRVGDYIYPEDNEPEVESIIVDLLGGGMYEFHPNDIKEIEVIE